jgi:hypothetical protein
MARPVPILRLTLPLSLLKISDRCNHSLFGIGNAKSKIFPEIFPEAGKPVPLSSRIATPMIETQRDGKLSPPPPDVCLFPKSKSTRTGRSARELKVGAD